MVKNGVSLSGGGTTKINLHEARTGDTAPSNVAGVVEGVLVRSRPNCDK